MKRKYQVFISSTYTDLKEERQAAVTAILMSGHIPAGMELFTAGDISQMDTIRKWILASDAFLVIVGGRYGTLEPTTGKSYVELEYDFAIENRVPLFALLMSEDMLDRKNKESGRAVLELDNPEKWKAFRKKVLSKISLFFHDLKDIEICIHRSIASLSEEHNLSGWVRAEAIEIAKVEHLKEQVKELRGKLLSERQKRYGTEEQLRILIESSPHVLAERLKKFTDAFESEGLDLTEVKNRRELLSKLIADLTPPRPEGRQGDWEPPPFNSNA